MMAICEHCEKEFPAQRSSAKFCSATCRIAAHRHRSQVERDLSRLNEHVQQHLDVVTGQRKVHAWERKMTRDNLLDQRRNLNAALEAYDKRIK